MCGKHVSLWYETIMGVCVLALSSVGWQRWVARGGSRFSRPVGLASRSTNPSFFLNFREASPRANGGVV